MPSERTPYPDELPLWIVWERAADGGRPHIRAIDTTEAMAERHVRYLKEGARVMEQPPPDLLVEETKGNHLYAQDFITALQRRRQRTEDSTP